MAQYQTNTEVQAHKPGMVDKVKAKAEGIVDKITGRNDKGSHTGTTAGVGGAAGYPQEQAGYGGQQEYTGTGTYAGYGDQVPTGHHHQGGQGGQQQYMGTGTDTGYGDQLPTGHHHQGAQGGRSEYTGTGLDTGYGEQMPTGHHPQQGFAGSDTAGYGQPQNQSMMDKVKNAVTPGHQSANLPGSGTGYQTGTGTGYGSSTAAGTGGQSLTDKIKAKLPGHHNAGAGTGYSDDY